MKSKFFVANMCLLVAILIGDLFYIVVGGLWIKAITSLIFVVIGLVNLIFAKISHSNYLKFSTFLFVGLVFAMLGDIVLNLHFISGATLFAVGHIFYFVAYCFLSKFQLKDLLVSAIIFIPAVLLILFAPIFNFGAIIMQIVCICYAIIISIMVGKSISLFVENKNSARFFIFIGSVLFFISDFMLLLNVFGNVGEWADVLCLVTYYPAQFCLAFSIFALCVFTKTKQVAKEK